MEQMCWRTEDWEDIPNIKRTYEELISFIAKNRENILRSNFENAIVTLSFVSAGYWYFALNIVQGKISLHCYWPILCGRSILAQFYSEVGEYLWESYIGWRLQWFCQRFGRPEGARLRTPTCPVYTQDRVRLLSKARAETKRQSNYYHTSLNVRLFRITLHTYSSN